MTTRDSTTQLLDQARKKRAPPSAPRGGPPRGGGVRRRPRGRPLRRGTRGRGRSSVRGRVRPLRRGRFPRGGRGVRGRRPAVAPPRPGEPKQAFPAKEPPKVEEKPPEVMKNKFPPKRPNQRQPGTGGAGGQGTRRPTGRRGGAKPYPPTRPIRPGRPNASRTGNSLRGGSTTPVSNSLEDRKNMFEKIAIMQPQPGGRRFPGRKVQQPQQGEVEEENLQEETLEEEALEDESVEATRAPMTPNRIKLIQPMPPQQQQQPQPQQTQLDPHQFQPPPQVEKKAQVQPQAHQHVEEEVEGEEEPQQQHHQQHQQHHQQHQQHHQQHQQHHQQQHHHPPSSNPAKPPITNTTTTSNPNPVSTAVPSSSGNGSSGGEENKKPIFQRRKEDQSFVDEVKEAFFIFDLNGDGTIEKSLIYEILNETQHTNHNEIAREIESAEKIDYPYFESLMKRYFAMPYSNEELRSMLTELEPVNGMFEMEDFQRALEEANGGNIEPEMLEVLEGLKNESNKLDLETMVKEMGSRL